VAVENHLESSEEMLRKADQGHTVSHLRYEQSILSLIHVDHLHLRREPFLGR
jgi:hypothetical protein